MAVKGKGGLFRSSSSPVTSPIVAGWTVGRYVNECYIAWCSRPDAPNGAVNEYRWGRVMLPYLALDSDGKLVGSMFRFKLCCILQVMVQKGQTLKLIARRRGGLSRAERGQIAGRIKSGLMERAASFNLGSKHESVGQHFTSTTTQILDLLAVYTVHTKRLSW